MNNQVISDLVDEFNSVMMDLVRNISVVCPTSIIADNISHIENIYTNICNGKTVDLSNVLNENDAANISTVPKNSLINLFMMHVLQYRNRIEAGDDTFFLGDECYKNINNSYMGKIFYFKDLWKSLKRENKDIVIEFMTYLCDIAQDYFNELDSNGLL